MKQLNFIPHYNKTIEPLEINGHVFNWTKIDPVELASMWTELEKYAKSGSVLTIEKSKEGLSKMEQICQKVGKILRDTIVDPTSGKDFMAVLYPGGLGFVDTIRLYIEIMILIISDVGVKAGDKM